MEGTKNTMHTLLRAGLLISNKDQQTAAGRKKVSLVGRAQAQAPPVTGHFEKLEQQRQTARKALEILGASGFRLSRRQLLEALDLDVPVTLHLVKAAARTQPRGLRSVAGRLDQSPQPESRSPATRRRSTFDDLEQFGTPESEAFDEWVEHINKLTHEPADAITVDAADKELQVMGQAVYNRMLSDLAQKVANHGSKSPEDQAVQTWTNQRRLLSTAQRRHQRQSQSPERDFTMNPRSCSALVASMDLQGIQPEIAQPASIRRRHSLREAGCASDQAETLRTPPTLMPAALSANDAPAPHAQGAISPGDDPRFEHWEQAAFERKWGTRAPGPISSKLPAITDSITLQGLDRPGASKAVPQGQRHTGPRVQPALPTLHPAKKETISIYAMRERQDTSDTLDRDAPVYTMQEYRSGAHLLSVQQKRKMVYQSVHMSRHIEHGHQNLDLRHQSIDNVKVLMLPNMIQNIPSFRQIRSLSLAHNAIGEPGCTSLCKAFTPDLLPCLERLDLSHNRLTKVSAKSIAARLVPLASDKPPLPLLHLDLSYNQIGDDGVASVASAVMCDTCKLQTLGMESCGLTGVSCTTLGKVLTNAPCLQALSVGWNMLGLSASEGQLQALGEGIAASKCLTSLDLSSCALRSSSAAEALATAIAGSRVLTTLNLNSNAIAQPGALAIAEALKANTQLGQLSMQSNPISRDGGTLLLIATQAHTKLQLDLRHCALFPAPAAAAATPAAALAAHAEVPTFQPPVWTRAKGKLPEERWNAAAWQAYAARQLANAQPGRAAPAPPLDALQMSGSHFKQLWLDMDLQALGVEWMLQYVDCLARSTFLTPDQCRAMILGLHVAFGLMACVRASVVVRCRSLLVHITLLHPLLRTLLGALHHSFFGIFSIAFRLAGGHQEQQETLSSSVLALFF